MEVNDGCRGRIHSRPLKLPVFCLDGTKLQNSLSSECQCQDNTFIARNERRKVNYKRRLKQLTSEGFWSPIWQPYKGVGDPIFLDEKELTLDALGLIEEVEDKEITQDITQYDNGIRSGVKVNPSKFMQQRIKKGAINLKKELRHSEEIGHFVRLGQSFFSIIDKETKQQHVVDERAKEAEIIRKRTEIQAPSSDVESDLEHSDIEEMYGIVIPISTNVETDETMISTYKSNYNAHIDTRKIERARSAAPNLGSRRQKGLPPRPYTPIYSNISQSRSQKSHPNDIAHSLYRQLCCVHWFLKAMTLEPPLKMTRILSSWNISNIGGIHTTAELRKVQSKTEDEWAAFLSDDTVKNTSREFVPKTYRPGSQNELIQKEKEDHIAVEALTSLFPHSNAEVADTTVHFKRKKSEMPTDTDINILSRKQIAELARCIEAEEEENSAQLYKEKRKYQAALRGSKLRPKSATADVVKSVKDFPSLALETFIPDQRIKFELNAEEKSLILKDRIEFMHRHRIKVCSDKFAALPTRGAAHRAIAQMRSKGRYEQSVSNSPTALAKRNIKDYQASWYLVLLKNLPEDFASSLWYNQEVLKRLALFSVMKSSKLTMLNFTKVMQSLQEWEICAPDVSAAAEFIREQVVQMTVEEFEEWFSESFPNIQRVQPPDQNINKPAAFTSQDDGQLHEKANVNSTNKVSVVNWTKKIRPITS